MIRYWNPICVVICAAMILLTIFTFPLVVLHSEDRSALGMVCVSVLFAAETICTILFVSVYVDRKVSMATFFFMCLISMEYIYLFMEVIHWDAKEVFQNDIVLNAIHHGEHMVLPVMLFLFVNYQLYILKHPGGHVKLQMLLISLLLIEFTLVLVNIPTEFLFTMDGLEVSNTKYRFLLFIPPSIMTAASVWVTLRFTSGLRNKITLLSCLLVPTIVALLSYPLHIPSFTAISILAVFLLLYGGVYVDRGTKIVKYEAEIMEQRVSLMVARIEPDFLDESLESIMNMEGNPRETRNAIDQFRKYLRENVNTISQKTPIPFETELAHVESYVRLEKLRFKNKLEVLFDISDRDFRLPAMTLQMLVENAIKHGITQKESGGTVKIRTELVADHHVITVSDDGVGFDVSKTSTEPGSHIGLNNLSSRVESMMGGTFEIESEIGKGTVARVLIPKG